MRRGPCRNTRVAKYSTAAPPCPSSGRGCPPPARGLTSGPGGGRLTVDTTGRVETILQRRHLQVVADAQDFDSEEGLTRLLAATDVAAGSDLDELELEDDFDDGDDDDDELDDELEDDDFDDDDDEDDDDDDDFEDDDDDGDFEDDDDDDEDDDDDGDDDYDAAFDDGDDDDDTFDDGGDGDDDDGDDALDDDDDYEAFDA